MGVSKPNSMGEGSITSLFDNVYVNGNLYDNFSSSKIDPVKWKSYEAVREVNDGKLSAKMALFGDTILFNSLNFAQPDTISSIQADVSLNSYAVTNGSISARLGGRFYNSGSPFDGDIYAQIRIGGPGPNPKIYYMVSRCPDNDCTEGITIKSSSFTGVTNLTMPYTLFVGWDGSVFTFRANGIEEDFDPKPYAPVINVAPNVRSRVIGNVANGSVAESSAYIDSTFDNVFINLP